MDDNFLENRLAAVAAAVADKTRARMLCMLMDGRAYTATELSTVADIAPSTASSHLARLLEQHLVDCIPQGRYRYFRIANRQVAAALETLMGLAINKATLRSKTPPNLCFARTCYDHMAGQVAVALYDRLVGMGWFDRENDTLNDEGQIQLSRLGIDCTPSPSRRRFAYSCLDWSERRTHLGGQLGAALLRTFMQQGWIIRQFDSRELQLTDSGRHALSERFGLSFPLA